jgi:hypothetical protein
MRPNAFDLQVRERSPEAQAEEGRQRIQRAEEDDPLAEETRVDVEGALTVHGLLDQPSESAGSSLLLDSVRSGSRSSVQVDLNSTSSLVRSAGTGLASRLSRSV